MRVETIGDATLYLGDCAPVQPKRYRWDQETDDTFGFMVGPVPDGEWVKWADVAHVYGVEASPTVPPTNEQMDSIYVAVLRQMAERKGLRPDEMEVDPRKHPSFYRALMHAAWLDGWIAGDASGVAAVDGDQR